MRVPVFLSLIKVLIRIINKFPQKLRKISNGYKLNETATEYCKIGVVVR